MNPTPLAILAPVVLCFLVSAAESDTAVTGWRGDGSGIYTKATPPLSWQHASTTIAGLRFQTQPPTNCQPSGTHMPDGVIREWLLLGPLVTTPGERDPSTDSLLVEDQTRLMPAAGQALAGTTWQIFKTDTAYLDCAQHYHAYGSTNDQAAYAFTYIYAPEKCDCIVRLMHSGALHVWLNGKPTHKFTATELGYAPQTINLQQGWNRLLLRITPARRMATGVLAPWHASIVFQADPSQSHYESKNIAWRTSLPARDGFGGLATCPGRIFLLSDPADLVCVDAASGKILWVRSNNYHELASPDERLAHPDIFTEIEPLAARLKAVNDSFATDAAPKYEKMEGHEELKEKTTLEKKLYSLMKQVTATRYNKPGGQDVGYAGFTPICDGRRVWGWSALGVSFCYDLDGNLLWRRLDNEGSFFEHGYATSPVLADGKLVVFMNHMMAFDATTGTRLWATELDPKTRRNRFEGTPAIAKIGTAPVIILPNGVILRLSDGRIIHDTGPDIATGQQEIPSPVVAGDNVYRLSTYSQLFKVGLPPDIADPLPVSVRDLKLSVDHSPTHYLSWHMSSPLIYDGLAYLLNNTGVLTVVDVEQMTMVYQKLLDLNHYQNHHEGAGRGIGVSPVLAGGRLYILGNTGVTLVLKPGRKYEQLARNQIESVLVRDWGLKHERFVANPAFDGQRMFIRGEQYLYGLCE